jgi:hypothetical protein
MSLRLFWWVPFVLVLVSLTLSGIAFVRYHRAGLPLPSGFVTGVIGASGGLLLVVSQLINPGDALWFATFSGSAILIGYSLLRSRRAQTRGS